MIKKKSGKKHPAKTRKATKPGPGTAKRQTRPSKYDPGIHPFMAWSLAIMGKINKEIAAGLSISTATLDSWQNLHPDFLSAIKGGKAVADAKVEQALFKRATGYEFESTETRKTEGGFTSTKVTKTYVSPDTTACIFWLKNRKAKDWKDVSKNEHSGPDGIPIPVSAIDIQKILGTDDYREYERKVFNAISAKPENAGS